MRRVRFVLIFLTLGCQIATAFALSGGPTPPAVSLEDKVSQLVLLEVYPGGNESHFTIVENQVKKFKPGGILARNGTPEQVAKLVDRLNRHLSMPLLVGGNLSSSGFRLPEQKVLQSISDKRLLHETGVLLGNRLRKAGIDMIIDPSLRMGSSEFEEYGNLLSQGYYTEGIIPAYSMNSYSEKFELPGAVILPYEAPVQVKKKFDYSQVNVTRMREAGVRQLILVEAPSDISMHPDWVLHALKSGADMVITNAAPGSEIGNVRKWLRGGKISEKDIDKKFKRVTERKFSTQQPYTEQVRYINSPSDHYIHDKLLSSSISMVRNEGNLLPFGHLDTLNIAYIAEPGFDVFKSYLGKYSYIHYLEDIPTYTGGYDVMVVAINETTPQERIGQLEELAKSSNVVIAAIGWKDLNRLKNFKNVVVTPATGNSVQATLPQVLFGAHAPKGKWAGQLPANFVAMNNFNTEIRVGYSHPLEVGMDPTTLSKIDGIALEAIEKGATPGMQVMIARSGKVIFEKSYGYFSYDQRKAVTQETIYDLASVTKVLATLQAVMFMSERRLIDVNKPLSNYLPELKGTNKEDMIIKDILLHQAGLRPWLPFWRETMDDDSASDEYYRPYPEEEYPLQVSNGMYAAGALRDSVWQWIIDSKLIKKKDGEFGYRYSDMGFYMMHRLSEQLLNQPLNEFVQQNIYDPLGMRTTTYLPLCKFDIEDIAPTANDLYFRKQLIAGLVHDEGAAMFGGVAGHSGLFSNANDLVKLLQMLLWKGEYGGLNFYSPETINQFTERQVKENRRGLGWDKPNVGNWKSPTSEFASAKTFGHTGFTGTAVWVDPEFDLMYIFLSNRINPDAENTKLMKLNIRSRIQDLIYKSIFELEQFNERLIHPEP